MSAEREQQLDEIIAGYLQSQECDEAVPVEELLAAHPEFATFMARWRFVQRTPAPG